jgi:hypothetical protein
LNIEIIKTKFLAAMYAILINSFILFAIVELSFGWSTVGVGVNYKKLNYPNDQNNNVLITYAGWNVNQVQVQAWTDRLLSYSLLNKTTLGLNHVYAVRGPADSAYAGKEIENSKLITHLYNQLLVNNNCKLIVIIAHSSGSFVCDEFFGQLYNKITANPTNAVYSSIKKRIAYYNLDG